MHGIIYVVDAADTDRLAESKETLAKALASEGIPGKPILVFANKQDLPGCLSAADLSDRMGLLEFKENRFQVSACQAKPAEGQPVDSRIGKGLNWLLDSIDSDYRKLNEQVTRETEEQKRREKERKEEQKKRAEAAKAARLKEQAEAEAAAAAAAAAAAQAEAAAASPPSEGVPNHSQEAAAAEHEISLVSSTWVEKASATVAAVAAAAAADAGIDAERRPEAEAAKPSAASAGAGARDEIQPDPGSNGGSPHPSGWADDATVRAAPRLSQLSTPRPAATDSESPAASEAASEQRRNPRLPALEVAPSTISQLPPLPAQGSGGGGGGGGGAPPGSKLGALRPMPPPVSTDGGGGGSRSGSPVPRGGGGGGGGPLLLPNAIESPQLPRSAGDGDGVGGPRRYQT